ncbi:MAG: hypothetical protein CVV64_19970 [Candidatus Wallbacteria bacterium HGW-Wallbacteria-1]|uniref:Tetratricopeptide repeat protein n=1 Tax=Candidatus Wallbacteria bacterium HGW-Wallbacteria-1 TaxID=2013854 RepID=A0A2N1PIM3_9BACT|nr:MAG: hypothetical protein CVV64_19970 [Candidatus Wallbacteria bacterium HGW-Wallbacteria-1]
MMKSEKMKISVFSLLIGSVAVIPLFIAEPAIFSAPCAASVLARDMRQQASEYALRGNYTMAARTLERLCALDPDDSITARILFDVYIRDGRFEKAEKLLMRLSALSRGQDSALQLLGTQLIEARGAARIEIDEARRISEEVLLELKPPVKESDNLTRIEPIETERGRPSFGPAFDPLWIMADNQQFEEAAGQFVSMALRSRQILSADDGGLGALLLDWLRKGGSQEGESMKHLFLRSAMESLAGSSDAARSSLRRYLVEYPDGQYIGDVTDLLAELESIIPPAPPVSAEKKKAVALELKKKIEVRKLQDEITTAEKAEERLASLESYSRDLQAEIGFIKKEFSNRRAEKSLEINSIEMEALTNAQSEDEKAEIKVFYNKELVATLSGIDRERDEQITEVRNRLTQLTWELLRVRKIQADLIRAAEPAVTTVVEDQDPKLIDRFVPESPLSGH